MRIATLSIGDELICGQVTDTNAGTIAAALIENGLRVQRHVTVGDRELDIMDAMTELGGDSDVIIATGGLGPTVDDMTTHAVARATGRRLVVNEEARVHVQQMSDLLNTLIVSPLNDKQVMLPTKTTIIPNPTGTACGFHLMHNNCYMFFMPGVPSEMRLMLRETVIPFLLERVSRKRVILTSQFNVFGPREAEVDELLWAVLPIRKWGFILVFVSRFLVCVSPCGPRRTVWKMLKSSWRLRFSPYGERLACYIYSEGKQSLAEKVAELFRSRQMTLALAESCTGGMVAQEVTSVSGSSAFFLEGAVTYSNDAKIRQLGVSAELVEGKGAVSSEVASAMSRRVRIVANSDVGLSVTGIAGPDGGSDTKPVGTVFISLATGEGCWTERFQFNGSREQIRVLTCWTALDWIRRYLEGNLEASLDTLANIKVNPLRVNILI